MQKLSGKSLLLVSFTLFSMFFGAGNLIFPPHLGAQAGTSLWPAFVGLAVSAVGLPIAGVTAVARAGGLDRLAGRVHPVFATVFTILVYLSIGPCLAIPRTASTSFQMLVPLIGGGTGLLLAYSVLFFAAAFLVALRPEKLTNWLGRILCPSLILLIVVLFAGCLAHPLAAYYGAPSAEYAALPTVQGILYGYQTMDTLAGLNFGAVIALNIRARGVTESRAVESGTVQDYVGRDETTGERIIAASSLLKFNGQVVGVMRYVTAIGNLDRQVFLTVLVVCGVMTAVICLIFLSSSIFINNVVAPVSAVSETAKRISAGSYGIQIPNKYTDEMGVLVDNINDMSLKISQSEKMESEFISSVSHELRTPLTAINGWGETLLEDESGDVQQLRRGVQIILKESRRWTSPR